MLLFSWNAKSNYFFLGSFLIYFHVDFCRENCEDKMTQFLKRCFYHSGQYNSEENFRELDIKLKEKEVMVPCSESKSCGF